MADEAQELNFANFGDWVAHVVRNNPAPHTIAPLSPHDPSSTSQTCVCGAPMMKYDSKFHSRNRMVIHFWRCTEPSCDKLRKESVSLVR